MRNRNVTSERSVSEARWLLISVFGLCCVVMLAGMLSA